ncbi:hypothetical protein C3F09_08605 [candidate division GN15 bacterium]|uniref:Uncharacterized protein n=1 Tax=candidate division GN15 bacterium TaxID=2072418 RepID=A0A855X4Z7_9BACT|nr:MAG: hypothetical protein C3F09_08605 [candidate division GN15 bacterium]
MKRTVPLLLAFFSGIVMVVAFFCREGSAVENLSQEFLIWSSIIGGFSLLLGAVSIVRVQWKNVAQRRSGWGFSIVTLVAVACSGLPAVLPVSWSPLFGRGTGSIYDWIFVYISTPMSGTMFGILAFYIASAAYRAFRARSAEATLLLVTATLVMLWRIPMGEAFLGKISSHLVDFINTYIMLGINLAVQRGIIIGAALGAASMSLRILLGIERTYMGRG